MLYDDIIFFDINAIVSLNIICFLNFIKIFKNKNQNRELMRPLPLPMLTNCTMLVKVNGAPTNQSSIRFWSHARTSNYVKFSWNTRTLPVKRSRRQSSVSSAVPWRLAS